MRLLNKTYKVKILLKLLVLLKIMYSLYIFIVPKQEISQFRIKKQFSQLFPMTMHICNLPEITPLYGFLGTSSEHFLFYANTQSYKGTTFWMNIKEIRIIVLIKVMLSLDILKYFGNPTIGFYNSMVYQSLKILHLTFNKIISPL